MLKGFSKRTAALAATGGAALALLAAAARLAAGPVEADWLNPILERTLASQVAGGQARVRGASLIWAGKARALGLRLDGVSLTDGRGRPVIRARRLEGAVALDALPALDVTPGRLAAKDFFVAVSVSPQGKYALGYDASGASEGASRLDRLLGDLSGRPRLGRPMSFLREVDLTNGRVALRQVGAPLAWTGHVASFRFEKHGKTLRGGAKIEIDDGRTGRRATLVAAGNAAVGLSNAFLWGRVHDLSPARVFPSVGSLAPLSALDAPVTGRGSVDYGLSGGVRAAEVTLTAEPGVLRAGRTAQRFEQARIVADYDPRTGEVVLPTVRFSAERTKLELRGRLRLTPEDRKTGREARVDLSIGGPHLIASLAPDAEPQALTNVGALLHYSPRERALTLAGARAFLGAAPVTASGVFRRDPKGRWGAKFDARIAGEVSPKQIFAFWPKTLVGSVRGWLHRGVQTGRLSNAVFVFDAAPGAFSKSVLRNQDFGISFDFEDAALKFADQLPAITQGSGRGLVQGNRFDLTLKSGRMGAVELSEGSIEMPAFKPRGKPAIYKARAIGETRDILNIIDGPGLQLLTKSGVAPSRTSGQADVTIEIERPQAFDATFDDYRIRYEGRIRKGGLTQAALGWDLTGGELAVEGDQDKVSLKGTGVVGPYSGKIDFSTRYHGKGDKRQAIDLDGVVQASLFGGRTGATAPFGGKFQTGAGAGVGLVHGSVFDGRVSWKPGDGRERIVVEGWGVAKALRALDVPFLDSVPDRFPADLRLSKAGQVFRGPVRADALSGEISFTPGARPRLAWQADLTPLEARRIGLGRVPMFEQTRAVAIDASFGDQEGTSQVRAGPLDLSLSWRRDAAGTERRISGRVDAADFQAVGLPSLVDPGQSAALTAAWRSSGAGIAGSADLDGTPLRFQTTGGRADVYTVRADLDRAAMRRLGAPDALDLDGVGVLTARFVSDEGRSASGRLDLDLTRARLGVARSDWRKPFGQPARLGADFVRGPDGGLRLTRLSGDGEGLDLAGSATVTAGGRLQAVDLSRFRLAGLVDGALKASRDPDGYTVSINGRWLDARRLFDDLSRPGSGAGGRGAAPPLIRIDADLTGLRLTDDAVLRDVSATGLFGPEAVRRLEVSASGVAGSRFKAKIYPALGHSAVSVEAADAGDIARTLFGVTSLRGGTTLISGRLVDGGADLKLDIRNVRLVKAPTMAQILNMASLQGMADTLNGEGVLFSHVVAPVQVRGRKITVGEARATGSALGLTAQGTADLATETVDFQGAIAPAYALNAVIGNVPVLGELLTSRKGEGLVALSYTAKGAFEKPRVTVNPLSMLAPGILRRMFEAPQKKAVDAPPPARTRRTAGEAALDGPGVNAVAER